MANDITTIQEQYESLYSAAAKQLYNLALFTIGNPAAAEQIVIDTFVNVLSSTQDNLSVDLFVEQSIGFLYRKGRKARKKAGYVIGCAFEDQPESPTAIKKRQLIRMLGELSYDERFMLLLFCWQRYSIKQIARIMCIPVFITRKRLCGTMTRAGYCVDNLPACY